MAEAICKKTQAEVKLVPSSGGAFEVTIDGKLVFSKLATGRFPKNEEILKFFVDKK